MDLPSNLWSQVHPVYLTPSTVKNPEILRWRGQQSDNAKGFKKAIAALEEQGLGKRLQVGTVWAFKASKPWP